MSTDKKYTQATSCAKGPLTQRPSGRFLCRPYHRQKSIGRMSGVAGILLTLCSTGTSLASDSPTAETALDASLACIAASDQTFRAVIALNEAQARDAARAVDTSTRSGALAGLPVLIKDNVETRELPTTAGSLALAANSTERDAPLVAQLRAAGALILGKTNLSEWANFRSVHSSSGWSGIGGQTRNAIDPTRSPCGSSSGSAVAVARGYVPLAVGTETSGSIVCPAAVNGVVGFKPTHGLVSGEGIVPLAPSQDTAGPIADSVMTAAHALAVMANPSVEAGKSARAGLWDIDTLDSIEGLRIGVWTDSLGFDVRQDAALQSVLTTLADAGATIIDGIEVARYPSFSEDSYKVLLYEFRRDIQTYLQHAPETVTVHNLDDLIAFNRRQANSELSVFDQSIFLEAAALSDGEEEYRTRLERIHQAMGENGLEAAFRDQQLDAIVGITSSLAWKIDPINGDAWFGRGMASTAAIAGNPHITLPLAEIEGLPLGISLYGKRWEDHKVARIAHWLEQAHPRPHYRWQVSPPSAMSRHCRPPQ